jgi:hypothetical protein
MFPRKNKDSEGPFLYFTSLLRMHMVVWVSVNKDDYSPYEEMIFVRKQAMLILQQKEPGNVPEVSFRQCRSAEPYENVR